MCLRILLASSILAIASNAVAQHATLPAKVDLVPEFQKLGILPQQQGERNTCSLFAITAVADFENSRHGAAPHPRLSEEYLVWAADASTGKTYDQAMFYEAVCGLNTLGICDRTLMPFASKSDEHRKPSAQAIADAKPRSERWQVHWIKRWDLKHSLTDGQIGAIQQALAAGHPVACGMRWPKSLSGSAILAVPPPDEVFDGHSIVLTGYEDHPGKKGAGTFRFRNSDGPSWGEHGYGTLSFAYVRKYANDALWLHLGSPHSEVPVERFEAESLPVLNHENCPTNPQNMDAFGKRMWSRGEQLFGGAKRGGSVELGFDIRRADRYRVRVLGTAAPNFGIIRITLDGAADGPEFDLYSGRVCPSGSLELGQHELAGGRHRLRVTVVGKNSASADHFFGLDAIDLLSPQ